jgi:hypothetical protein
MTEMILTMELHEKELKELREQNLVLQSNNHYLDNTILKLVSRLGALENSNGTSTDK